MPPDPYLLDNADPNTETRFGELERLYDPTTVAVLDRIGFQSGRCWEIGAGHGSIAHHLADRVELRGAVLASDIDTRWFAPHPNVTLVRHDVATEPAPGRFDLIHARLVLQHITDWPHLLPGLVDALTPGGWLVVEELDPLHPYRPDAVSDTGQLINRVGNGFTQLLGLWGADYRSGRRLHTHLAAAGLGNVTNTGHQVVSTGADPAARLMQANIRQLGPDLIAQCGISLGDIEAYIEALGRTGVWFLMPVMFSAAGQKPLTGGPACT